MTSYQSRLRGEYRLTHTLNSIAFMILLVSFIGMKLAYIGAKHRHTEDRVGLLTCNEFLSNLEASETFEE